MIVRHGLVDGGARPKSRQRPLISFLFFADPQLGDEELTLPSRTDWRKNAAFLPHMMNAQLRAANRIAEDGSPIFGQPFSMAFGLGDLADNAQYNETRMMIDLFDGGKLVDPDSGSEGYVGVKTDPKGAGHLERPVTGSSILDLANEPFWATGLHNPDGSKIPWYAVHGNHDSKVLGRVPHDDPRWREAADGALTFHRCDPSHRRRRHHVRHGHDSLHARPRSTRWQCVPAGA